MKVFVFSSIKNYINIQQKRSSTTKSGNFELLLKHLPVVNAVCKIIAQEEFGSPLNEEIFYVSEGRYRSVFIEMEKKRIRVSSSDSWDEKNKLTQMFWSLMKENQGKLSNDVDKCMKELSTIAGESRRDKLLNLYSNLKDFNQKIFLLEIMSVVVQKVSSPLSERTNRLSFLTPVLLEKAVFSEELIWVSEDYFLQNNKFKYKTVEEYLGAKEKLQTLSDQDLYENLSKAIKLLSESDSFRYGATGEFFANLSVNMEASLLRNLFENNIKAKVRSL